MTTLKTGTDVTADGGDVVVTENRRTGDGQSAVGAQKRKREAGKRAFKELTREVRPWLLAGQILAAVSGILSVAPYVALVHLGAVLLTASTTGNAVDAEQAWGIVQILIGTFCAQLGLYVVALIVTHLGDQRLVHSLRVRLMDAITSAPLAWFTENTSGRIRKAVQDDTKNVHALVAHQPVEFVRALAAPLALAGYACWVDWRLGLLALSSFPVYGTLMAVMLRGLGDKMVEMDARLGDISTNMIELVNGISVVKAFGRAGRAHRAYRESVADFAHFYRELCRPFLRASALGSITIAVPVLLLVNVGGGAAMAQAGWVSPVEVVVCAVIALVLPASMEVVGNSSFQRQIAEAAALRLVRTMRTEPLPTTVQPVSLSGHDIVIDDVTFSYGHTRALDGVSLNLPEGSITALIGPSGSGKSTLATLVARFGDPDGGRILLGGVDLRDISPEELYRHVAFVLQDSPLLHTTIRRNVALGQPEASDADIWHALREARAEEFVRSLPRGLDEPIDSHSRLSGGQAQRIAIARSLLADAPVLILDEATAFTDPECEAEIQEALDRLVAGRTVIVIAHRPGAVRTADQIVILDRGRVVGCGTHDQLREHPHYLALFRQAHGADLHGADGKGN